MTDVYWQDGEIKHGSTLTLDARDRGLLLGDGLFETIRVSNGHPEFLLEHLCRLQQSGNELGIPVDRSMLRQGLFEVLGEIDRALTGSVRITITRGPGPRGLSPIDLAAQQPSALITAAASASPPQTAPDQLVLAPFALSSAAPSTRHKTLSYTDNLNARAYAAKQGADDAVFLNEYGDIAGTTMANLFVLMDDVYVTPPLSAGMLPGITRAQILREAGRSDVKIRVRHLTPAHLEGHWLFRSNSLLGVRPCLLRHEDDGASPKGPPPEQLSALLSAARLRDRP